MNITQQVITAAGNNTQEVLLRTRASDAASVEHGNQIPLAEQVTAHFAPAQNEDVPIGNHSHTSKIVIILLVIATLIGLVYFVVYPYLTNSVPATL